MEAAAPQPAPCPAASAPLATRLPPDVIRRIFNPTVPSKYSRGDVWLVLQLDAHARAELVCRHWHAALSAQPAEVPHLDLGAPDRHPYKMGAAVQATAARRARWLAARAPVAGRIEVQLCERSPGFADFGEPAFGAALGALAARPGARTLVVSVGEFYDLGPCLATVAEHPSVEALELVSNFGGGPGVDGCLVLRPAAGRLPALPHVRRLAAAGFDGLAISLPMPRLESLTGPRIVVEETGPESAELRAPGAMWLMLNCTDAPVLAHLRLDAFFFGRAASASALQLRGLSALTALTRLELGACASMHLDWMPWSDGGRGGQDLGCLDLGGQSNRFAPLLAAAAPRLRALALKLGEAPDAPLRAALAAATGLTSLTLIASSNSVGDECDALFRRPSHMDWTRWGGKFSRPPKGEPPPPCAEPLLLDLFAIRAPGLARLALEDCATSPRRVPWAGAATLERPPALAALRLWPPAHLPALAPHLPRVTRLELPYAEACSLARDAGARAALATLSNMRCLALRRGEQEDVDRVRAHLPAGCVVEKVGET
eukprot:scaffold1.g5699.t1